MVIVIDLLHSHLDHILHNLSIFLSLFFCSVHNLAVHNVVLDVYFLDQIPDENEKNKEEIEEEIEVEMKK